jgi:hypothetical protein
MPTLIAPVKFVAAITIKLSSGPKGPSVCGLSQGVWGMESLSTLGILG